MTFVNFILGLIGVSISAVVIGVIVFLLALWGFFGEASKAVLNMFQAAFDLAAGIASFLGRKAVDLAMWAGKKFFVGEQNIWQSREGFIAQGMLAAFCLCWGVVYGYTHRDAIEAALDHLWHPWQHAAHIEPEVVEPERLISPVHMQRPRKHEKPAPVVYSKPASKRADAYNLRHQLGE